MNVNGIYITKVRQKCLTVPLTIGFLILTGLFNVFSGDGDRNRSGVQVRKRQPVDWADPLIGSATDSRWMLHPGPSRPFGMVKLAPDNDMGDTLDSSGDRYGGGYVPSKDWVHGFSHLHSWTISGLSLLPRVGDVTNQRTPPAAPDTYPARISPDTLEVSPAHFRVRLPRHKIDAEMTSTTRAALHRYTFPESESSHIIVTFAGGEYGKEIHDAKITRTGDRELEGYVSMDNGYFRDFQKYTHYFVLQFDHRIESMDGWNGDNQADVKKDVDQLGGDANRFGVAVHFDTEKEEQIRVKAGVSFVSIDSARNNLKTEIGLFEDGPFGWDYNAVVQDARREWNNLFGRIDVEMNYKGGDENKRKFYTGLYRSYSRTIMSDANGKYTDMFEETRTLEDPEDPVYGGDAFWNTFWNLNQLWTLATPDITRKWIKSQLKLYEIGGWLPKGPAGIEYSGIMRGMPFTAFIAGAYQHGIRNFDHETAYRAVLHAMTTPGKGTAPGGGDSVGIRSLDPFIEHGYVPADQGRTSDTMQIAYNYWCAGTLAEAFGKKGKARTFYRGSRSWRNTFDREGKRFLRRKNADGSWTVSDSEYDPFTQESATEGTLWQYSWFVPHDVPSLVEIMGRDRFVRRLKEGFQRAATTDFHTGHRGEFNRGVNHGNQPNMQAAYLFNYAGQPWRTQKWARTIMDRYYGAGEQGYPGDEDSGQMGGWFVMSALGLFQTDGGVRRQPIYEFGSPLITKATVQLDQRYYAGKELKIVVRNNRKKNKFIQSAKFNGEPLNKPWIRAGRLLRGGTLIFEMGSEPNKNWGAGLENAPPSPTTDPGTESGGK